MPHILGGRVESQASRICSLRCRGQVTGWTLGLGGGRRARQGGRREGGLGPAPSVGSTAVWRNTSSGQDEPPSGALRAWR